MKFFLRTRKNMKEKLCRFCIISIAFNLGARMKVILAVDVPKSSGNEVRLLEDYFSGLKIAKY